MRVRGTIPILRLQGFPMAHFSRLGLTDAQVKQKLDKMLEYAVHNRMIRDSQKGEWSDPERLIMIADPQDPVALELGKQFRMRVLTDSLPSLRKQWDIRSDLVRSLPFVRHTMVFGMGLVPVAGVTPEGFVEADSGFDVRVSYLDIGAHEIGTDLKPGHLVENSIIWKGCLRRGGVEAPGELKDYDWDDIRADRKLYRAGEEYYEWVTDPETEPFRELRAVVSQVAILEGMRENEEDASFSRIIDHRMMNAFANLELHLNRLSGATPKQQELARGSHRELVEESRALLADESKYVG